MKDYFWSLDGWNRLTAMDDAEKGVAVSLSLGGRAGKIARSIPQASLNQPWGLALLCHQLEIGLGQELQELQRHYFESFMKLRRARGCSAADHIVNFEQALEEAIAHGAQINNVLRSHLLIKSAALAADEERYVMQCVAGNYEHYNQIRAAMRRMPLDNTTPGIMLAQWDGWMDGASPAPRSRLRSPMHRLLR
jgi:hypothetical protein